MKNDKQVKISNHFTCSAENGGISLKHRIANIFDDNKKRRGIIVIAVILIIAVIAGSFVVFGSENVKQTNKSLTVYTFGTQDIPKEERSTRNDPTYTTLDPYIVDEAITQYQHLYPDVEVNIVEFDDGTHDGEYLYSKLYVELMAGKGPDVIIGDSSMCMQKDISKMIKSGIFAPLNDFIEKDDYYNQYTYYDEVLDNGFYRGQQYLIPLRFSINMLASNRNTLEDAGIDVEKCKSSYVGFLEEINKYILANPDNTKKLFATNTKLGEQLRYMGVAALSDELQKNSPEVNKMFELYKQAADYELYDPVNEENEYHKIVDETGLFVLTDQNPYAVFSGIPFLSEYGEPVLIPMRRPDGGINAIVDIFAGINANSENQQNAYNLIRMLIGPNAEFFFDKGMSSNREITENILKFTPVWPGYEKFIQIYADEYVSFLRDVDNAYFLSPLDNEIMLQMQLFSDGKLQYEECIKTVQEKIEIYMSE